MNIVVESPRTEESAWRRSESEADQMIDATMRALDRTLKAVQN